MKTKPPFVVIHRMTLIRVAGAVQAALVLLPMWRALYWPSYWTLLGGLSLAVAGFVARVWATRYGKARPGRLLTTGPYRLCRHPRYLGTWLVCAGVVVLVTGGTGAAAPFLWIPTILLMGFVVWLHVPAGRYETSVMIAQYGQEAIVYAVTVPAFIPGTPGRL